MAHVWAAAVLVIAVWPSTASAQGARWEVGVGGVFNGSADAGTVNATLLDPAGEPLTLFRTSNRMASGWGAEGLISRRLSERLRLELAIGWGKTDFESEITSDFENVPDVIVSQQVSQYTGELALAYRVVQRSGFDVFLRAGGGGFREITDDRALVDNGWRASVGAGTQFGFGVIALRADVRLLARGGGIEFGDSGTRLSPLVFAGLVIGK